MGTDGGCNRAGSMKTWLAPAKLNLFLHVVGQRTDGLHELQTLFQLLDFGDLLSFEITENGSISRDGGSALPAEDLCICVSVYLWREEAEEGGRVSEELEALL